MTCAVCGAASAKSGRGDATSIVSRFCLYHLTRRPPDAVVVNEADVEEAVALTIRYFRERGEV